MLRVFLPMETSFGEDCMTAGLSAEQIGFRLPLLELIHTFEPMAEVLARVSAGRERRFSG